MKYISDARAAFRTILKSKDLKEFIDNISWGMLEKLAFITVIFFVVSPVTQFLSNVISYLRYDAYSDYSYVVNTSNRLAAIFGITMIVLFMGKSIRNKLSFKDFFRWNPAMVFFIPMLVIIFVSTAANGFCEEAMHGVADLNETLFSYLIYFAIYYFCASTITGTKLKALIEYAFICCSIVLAVTSLFHVYVSPIQQYVHFVDLSDTINAVFYHFNHYGYYLAMSVLLCASLFVLENDKILRGLSLAGFLLNSVVLVLNDTFGSYLAALFGLVFAVIVISLCQKKLNILPIVMLGVFLVITAILSLLQTNTFSNFVEVTEDVGKIVENTEDSWLAGTGRWHLWRTTYGLIKEKPLLGYGVEGCSLELLEKGYALRAHNEYIQYAAFFGIPGAVIYICGIMSVFLRALKKKSELDIFTITAVIASFTYCVSAFTGNSKFYIAPLFFTMLGLANTGKKHP